MKNMSTIHEQHVDHQENLHLEECLVVSSIKLWRVCETKDDVESIMTEVYDTQITQDIMKKK